MSDLAERVKTGMREKGLRNADLAKICGVKTPTSHNWASGKTKNIKGEPLLLAAKAFGFTPRWLATGKGPKYAEKSGVPDANVEGPPVPVPPTDDWTAEALRILGGLSLEDKRAAVIALRTFVQNIGPPRDGQTLSMAA